MKDASVVISFLSVALLSFGCGRGERLEKLIAGLDTAAVSLQEAIDTAADEFPDGVVVEAEFEVEEGEPFYEVEVLVGDEVKEVSIDPQTGEVLSIETEIEGDEVAVPCSGSISIVEAVQEAQEAGKGSPVEVEIEGCEFEVQVVSDDELYEVEIGPDGQVREIEESDEDDEDDDGDLDEDEEDDDDDEDEHDDHDEE